MRAAGAHRGSFYDPTGPERGVAPHAFSSSLMGFGNSRNAPDSFRPFDCIDARFGVSSEAGFRRDPLFSA